MAQCIDLLTDKKQMIELVRVVYDGPSPNDITQYHNTNDIYIAII